MFSLNKEKIVNNEEKEEMEFKRPQSPCKRPKVLTEDKYIEEMSKIIQRDFFPDLEKLRAQNDYLDAMERNDLNGMDAIRTKYSRQRKNLCNNNLTPATFDTPSSNYDSSPVQKSSNPSSEQISKTPLEDCKTPRTDHLSLDVFLQNYTSEDNYSFQEIIKKADEKLKKKFEALYSEERYATDELKRILTLPSIEKQFEEPNDSNKIATWRYTNKNSIMYIPDGVSLTAEEKQKFVVNRQSIHHVATRLSKDVLSSYDSSKQSEKNNCKDSVEFEKILTKTGTPKIEGFNLVQTPSPRPGEAFTPLMTWGEIEGTPFRLDGSDTPISSTVGPSFKITENSRRENIALELAENVGRKMRAQKNKSKNAISKSSPFIRANMQRLASMSPAARRLATSKLGLRSDILTPTFSPLVTPKKGTNRTKKDINTPIRNENSIHLDKMSKESSTLTDNLLKIPTLRLKAADFF